MSPHPIESMSTKRMTSILREMAALYWSSMGTLALSAQNPCMYRAVPKCSARASKAGQMVRNGATSMLPPVDMKRP